MDAPWIDVPKLGSMLEQSEEVERVSVLALLED